ncbi:MAG: glycosyltransferase [Candidatus Eisenbacteria bacterium]
MRSGRSGRIEKSGRSGRSGRSERGGRIPICRVQSRICVGGPAQQTILLSSRLNPSRFRTVLIGGATEPGEKDLLDAARAIGVRAHRLGRMRRSVHPVRDVAAFADLCRIFRRERPWIVHTHTAKAGALGRLAARACGVPIVVHTFHGHVLDGYFAAPVSQAFTEAERMLAAVSDRIVVISESQKRELCERHRVAPPEKVRVVPLGLDLARFAASSALRRSLRAEIGAGARERLVGWVGRLTDVKNPDLLLQAASAAIETLPHPVRFVVVGDGALRGPLEEQARSLGLAGRITFLGYRTDLDRILADLDLLLLTSKNEGTPVAVIEAMAAGIPVVCTSVGGVPEIVRGYPLATLVADRDPRALAAAMRRYLDRPGQRAERSDVAKVVQRFGADRLLRDIEALYDELLEEKGIRGGSLRGEPIRNRRASRAA